MAKGKHTGSRADTRELPELRDRDDREPKALFEYEDDGEESGGEERLKKMKVPKAVYRVGIILLVLVLALALWINRDSLDPEQIGQWLKVQFMGSGQGDGFPVAIVGSSVSPSNFTSYGGNVYILSDTALTILSSSGKELLSLRHSLNEPVLRAAHGKTLLYNQGSTGYTVLSGTEKTLSDTAEQNILVGDVAQSGRFALGFQGSDGASEFQVYQKDGSLQYHYLFAKDYITAIALNYDGTWGLVCTMRGEKGGITSKATVFDFNQEEPVASFEIQGDLLIDACWTEGGDLYAVGDSALLRAQSSDYAFEEYNYEGRQLTAYRMDQGRAFLSISAYEHAGPCTLLVFHGMEEPLEVESDQRIVSLSASGGTIGALVESSARFYDYSTGEELGRADAGSDAKSLALSSERMAYILGVSEIRAIQLS